MSKYIKIAGLLALLAAAMAVVPIRLSAAEAENPAAERPASSKVVPFHGKLDAVDKTAMTITVGKRTFQITSETKIMKDGKPAILDDAAVGDTVGGAYKKADDGKLTATMVRFGPAPEKPPKKSKAKDDAAEKM